MYTVSYFEFKFIYSYATGVLIGAGVGGELTKITTKEVRLNHYTQIGRDEAFIQIALGIIPPLAGIHYPTLDQLNCVYKLNNGAA